MSGASQAMMNKVVAHEPRASKRCVMGRSVPVEYSLSRGLCLCGFGYKAHWSSCSDQSLPS